MGIFTIRLIPGSLRIGQIPFTCRHTGAWNGIGSSFRFPTAEVASFRCTDTAGQGKFTGTALASLQNHSRYTRSRYEETGQEP